MTVNHINKLVERLESDTFLDFLDFGGVKSDTSKELLGLIHKRHVSKFTQKDVAKNLNISRSKVKRFEAGKVDSLRMYLYYKLMFEKPIN